MKTKRIKIDLSKPASIPMGRLNAQLLDATTDEDIFLQVQADEHGAVLDAAKFARRVRRRLGLTQLEFSQRIDVSLDTIRNWEQGKRSPTGAAKALLKVLDKSPEAALLALS
jgi:putative transcriptional regulator